MEVKPLKLPKIDDVFGSGTDPGDTGAIMDIEISQLHEFFRHVFDVPDENSKKMQELMESVQNHGILMPLIVRRRTKPQKGGFEVIAGHCRTKAATLIGKKKVPCIVRNYDDNEATIVMVDTNIQQREDITIWEKAWAYRLKSEAMRHRGAKGGVTTEDIGQMNGESGRQIRRYIRVSYLIPQYKPYVNSKKVGLLVAVSLSYLPDELQDYVLSFISQGDVPSVKMAEKMRSMYESDGLTEAEIYNLFRNEEEIHPKRNISIDDKTVNKYFPPNMKKDEIVGIIDQLIKEWTLKNHPELLKEDSIDD